jgi:N-acylglucosamine 2-epimerase
LYSGDRKVSFVEHVTRKENYHHPRCVMRNLLALERMIAREGAVSDF